jgi:putative phosphoribosyl transferase
MLFKDRHQAGQILASRLKAYANRPDVIVVALPRGGVPVGYEVAKALNVPLSIFVVRKLGVPGREELAMGAVASGGVRVLNEDVVDALGIPPSVIHQVTQREQGELERRERDYQDGGPPLDVRGRTVILVDDGLATGSSMRVAAEALKQKQPAHIVVAVPVAASSTCEELQSEVDEVICAAMPEPLQAVGLWYQDFPQTSDKEVRDLLRTANQRTAKVA